MQPVRTHNIELPEKNYKAIMNEYCQKNYLPLPDYVTEYASDSTGFVAVLTVCDKEYRSKPRASKKKAEQNVAGIAALGLGLVTIDEGGGGESLWNRRERAVSPVSSNSSFGGLSSSFGSRFSGRTAAGPESELQFYDAYTCTCTSLCGLFWCVHVIILKVE